MSEKRIEILGGVPGKEGTYLNWVHDPESGKYFAPLPLETPEVKKLHEMGMTGKGTTVAILDTGLMLNHPLIKRSLIKSVDFTGEGPDDLNGHGTIVALILLSVAPDVKIFNVKVLDSHGEGEEGDLIKGIHWAAEQHPQSMNISAGFQGKKWGFLECKGDCKICRAAEDAARKNILVVAAAGNEPGVTTCPATLGMVKEDSGVLSVAAYDIDNNMIAPYSGKGNIAAPVGKYHFAVVE